MRRPEQDTITIEDRTLRNGFTRIPNGVLRREGLSPGAKLAYMGLLSYAWQEGSCFPGQARLAHDLGVGQRSVIRYLKELQAIGLLQVQRRGLGKTNLYILPKDDAGEQDEADTAEPAARGRSRRAGSARMAVQELPEADPPEVPDWHREEDAGEEDSDLSKHRKGSPRKGQQGGRRQSYATSTASAASGSGRKAFAAVGDALKERLLVRSRTRSEASASDRDIVTAYMHSIALELRDQAPLRSTVTRLLRIYEASEVDSISAFVDVLHRAKAIARERVSSIRAGEPGARRAIPYFTAIVEDLVGLRDKEERARASEP